MHWTTWHQASNCQVPIEDDPKGGVKGMAAAKAAKSTDEGAADTAAQAVAAPKAEKEMALPFEKMSLVFRNIDYYVPMPGGKRGEELQLLKKCWGAFKPGVLTALMGASGAGKTTLMDLLAGAQLVVDYSGGLFGDTAL